jgi:hypothetical protein
MNDETLVHMAGYTALSSILGTATWADPVALIPAGAMVGGTLYYAGRRVLEGRPATDGQEVGA